MRKIFLLSGLSLFVLSSCQNSIEPKLIKKWRVVKVDNPAMLRDIENARIDIDTTGDNDPIIREAVNLDSLKRARLEMLEYDIQEQQKAMQALRFNFTANKRVYITGIETNDSAAWRIEDGNKLIFDGPALNGVGEVDIYTIVSISADSMHMQNINMADTTQIFLVPSKD